jgi:DNA polymerase (family X)
MLFDEQGLRTIEGESLDCATEDELYRRLGLVPADPERREAGVPLVEEGKARPRLVVREDLRGALHNHTIASDGSATLPDMRDAAAARGLSYLGISEHSVSAFYARGLAAEALRAQIQTIAQLNEKARSKCVLLTGVESDILAEGTLDYPSDVLSELEVIVASVHRRHSQDAAQMTARLVAAAQNPWTSVIGHPTGRLLLGRPPSDLDMGAFLDACKTSGCAVELNANPHRLDLCDRHVAMAKERGVLVSIAADAHSVDELDNLAYGVTIARRGGLTAEDVLNARSLEELRAWLNDRHARALG